METSIITALISAAVTLFGLWMTLRAETKKREVNEAVRQTQLDDRLNSIESKLDEHNGYAEKFVQQGTRLEAIEKSIVALGKDIEYLKKGA